MNVMNWIAWTVGVIIVLVLAVLAVGSALPVVHTASRTVLIQNPPEMVWNLIFDVPRYPSWRRGIVSVDALPHDSGVAMAWREHDEHGSLSYETAAIVSMSRFSTRITDTGIPFGGGWTFELAPTSDGTSLKITENGEIYNPFLRFMARYVFGYYKSIDAYVADLKRELNRRAVKPTIADSPADSARSR
jgi:hypothetical protein